MILVDLTVDELVETLKRTSLPTVITEGKDDVVVYRRMEAIYASKRLSVFPAGGRDKVLAVYDRRDELPADQTFLFIADQDTWIYTALPPHRVSEVLIFTDGYSVENDCYRDGRFEEMLTPAESATYLNELTEYVRWYALALQRHLADPTEGIDHHPNEILDGPIPVQDRCQCRANETYPAALQTSIAADYAKQLRGKALMDLIMRQLSYTGRRPRHNATAMLEMAAANPGPNLTRVIALVGEQL